MEDLGGTWPIFEGLLHMEIGGDSRSGGATVERSLFHLLIFAGIRLGEGLNEIVQE